MKMGPSQKGELFFAEFYMLLYMQQLQCWPLTEKCAGSDILEHKKLSKVYSSLQEAFFKHL
jgi:hypothetical protein